MDDLRKNAHYAGGYDEVSLCSIYMGFNEVIILVVL